MPDPTPSNRRRISPANIDAIATRFPELSLDEAITLLLRGFASQPKDRAAILDAELTLALDRLVAVNLLLGAGISEFAAIFRLQLQGELQRLGQSAVQFYRAPEQAAAHRAHSKQSRRLTA